MSEQSPEKQNTLFTFLGSLGAILIFALIIFVAYLPNRPEPVDADKVAERQRKADESRAAGIAKISDYAVAGDGTVQIPVEAAMDLVVKEYND